MIAAAFILRCLLCAALGIALAVAGVSVLSWHGAVVYGILLAIAVLDGCTEVYAYRRGRAEGVRFAVFHLVAAGWRKS